jgi:hypothetical protein
LGYGRFDYADETADRGLSDVGDALGCLAFDEDSDGDDDLLITGMGEVRLYINDGGYFVDASSRLGIAPDPRDMYMSAAAGDLDGDGDVDIFVSGYLRYDPNRYAAGDFCGDAPCEVSVKAYDPIPDLLLMRGRGGHYIEASTIVAPDLLAHEPGLSAAVADIDGDGVLDIYVGNDGYKNRVLSRCGTAFFEDVATDLGLSRDADGFVGDATGWTSGDVDLDGQPDYVTTSVERDATDVFVCRSGSCVDRGRDFGVSELAHTYRWGAALFDPDLDGDLDLVEATGHFYPSDEARELGFEGALEQPANFLENVDGARFQVPAEMLTDGLSTPRAARGIAVADLDEDGRPDLVLAPAMGRPAVLRNVRKRVGHWLRVALVGRAPNTGAVGARVEVRTPRHTLVKHRRVGEGYLGNFDPRMHFGVPGYQGTADVLVHWPSGATTELSDVVLDRGIVVHE